MSKFVFAAAMAVALLSSPAFAGEPAQLPAMKVSTAGVDFRDPADVKAFYGRIEKAAAAVCAADARKSGERDAEAACTTKAVANAVAAADKPLLTAELRCGCSELLYAAVAQKH